MGEERLSQVKIKWVEAQRFHRAYKKQLNNLHVILSLFDMV